MTFFGNLALLLALIGYFSLATMAGKPTPGGDAGVGHAFALLFAYAAVAAGITIATALVFWKGGLGWISEKQSLRNALVVLGWTSVIVFSFFAAMNGDGGAPWIMRFLGKYVAVWALPPLLVVAFVLVNPWLQSVIPNVIWQWALKGTVVFCAVSCLAMMGEWLINIPVQAAQRAEAVTNEEAQRKQQFLKEIENTDAQTSLVTILVFTNKYQDTEVRKAALTKIKSNPQWQQYLVSRLETPWAGEVFAFLADNDVPDKSLFFRPIETGILEMAKLFEDGMRRTHTFYDGQFYSETEDVLETIAKFEGSGINYVPAVRKLRAALDTPLESYQNRANLRCIPVLDKWLKKHAH